jgi:hypothetical protein
MQVSIGQGVTSVAGIRGARRSLPRRVRSRGDLHIIDDTEVPLYAGTILAATHYAETVQVN